MDSFTGLFAVVVSARLRVSLRQQVSGRGLDFAVPTEGAPSLRTSRRSLAFEQLSSVQLS